mgnify:CR=1 FL=1
MSTLPFAHGGPPLRGRLRAEAEDFEVDEQLGFTADGQGEHLFLRIEKRGANTEWVARQLAARLGVAPAAVGFSGLKDRHALTRQTFSVHLPGLADPDPDALAIEGVRVLEAARHSRKLKRGTHKRNAFRIRLTALEGDAAAAGAVLATIAERGVPNYFGEQRFGRGEDNLRLAEALFSGARLDRQRRGFALSAARSALFNRVLGARVAAGNWDAALDGEVWMLAGTHSIFGPQAFDAALAARLAAGDIDPTGPLWGRGDLRSSGEVAALEQGIAEGMAGFAAGLAAAGLGQERRALRLRPAGFVHEREGEDVLVLTFSLPAGTFATSVVRELCAVDERPRSSA